MGPKWPIRGWHYHTEHPLELTNFLNGWGTISPDDQAGWEAMMPEWHMFLEWLVANRQNAIEFLLLAADEWQSFVASPVRQNRLAQINSVALQWGVAVASDVPIAGVLLLSFVAFVLNYSTLIAFLYVLSAIMPP